jgi:K+:H+ antiporter
VRAAEIAQLCTALTLIVIAAHLLRELFRWMRQPPVIGEILAGIVLGPTLLGRLVPGFADRLIPGPGITPGVLAALSQLGLILLMFLSGREVARGRLDGQRRSVAVIAVAGLVAPVAAGIGLGGLLDRGGLSGPRGSAVTFALVLGIAVGVASIPVISRIMLDLGILGTRFARTVLAVAVLEDVVLYAVLAVILGLAQAGTKDAYGLLSELDGGPAAVTATAYVLVNVVFFGVFLAVGGRLFRVLAGSRVNVLERRDPTAFRVSFLLLMVLGATVVGLDPIFGALLAGISVARGTSGDESRDGPAWDAIQRVATSLFIPIYFVSVGLKLDLVRHFDVWFFVWFLAFACVVKGGSVWLGARLSGHGRSAATDLAAALNARGGPGIVLASVTYAAGVITEDLYTVLVMLSIVTSQAAGVWLEHRFGRPAATEPAGSLTGRSTR